MKLFKATLIGLLVILSGCGGGGSSSANEETQPEDKNQESSETGVFLDSAVGNIGYRTETFDGFTNALGEYEYLDGESIIFYIGSLELPSATAASIVTPLDLAGTQDTSNDVVVNVSRLLQTLDEDGNPDNGITISESAVNAASQVDFSLPVEDFETSGAVQNLVANSGSPNTTLIPVNDAIEHLESTLDENFSIDMSERTAASVITYSECPSVPGVWVYSFTDSEITLTGSDTWEAPPGCGLNGSQSMSLVASELGDDFDVPFNCAAYPVCTIDDFEKTITGVDGGGRSFTSTYTFDRESLQLTYEKSAGGETYSEVITISQEEAFSIDMSGRSAASVITYSECPSTPGGWDYSFTGTEMTLTGSDTWETPPGCTLNASESISLTVSELGDDFDVPFNCAEYPVCTIDDLWKVESGVDGSGRSFTSTYTFDRETLMLEYVKSVDGVTYTEEITIE
ncbi:MAG: hypothetical protein ACQES2_05730 [Pseudomonadota bacterium]